MAPRHEPVKVFSFTFAFIVMHVLVHVGIVCWGVAAIAEDNNVRNTSCDNSFHIFKYCGFNGAGFVLSLVTYFLLSTGEAARARAAALAIMHCGCATWGLGTWDDLADSACETVYRDQYQSLWLYWNTLVYANCFYGLMYLLHELVWSRYSNSDLTVVCEAQSAASQMQYRRSGGAENHSKEPIFQHSKGGIPTGGYQASDAASTGQNQPVPPELQAEYHKVVAGVEYQEIVFTAEDSSISPETEETTI